MFWLRKSKATKDGMAPIYPRITIGGKDENISLSRKANPIFWDNKSKRVAEAKAANLKIGLVENDLERNFTAPETLEDTKSKVAEFIAIQYQVSDIDLTDIP